MGKPFTKNEAGPKRQSHLYVYKVEIKERATYEVFARGRNAAEAIRAAEKAFLSKEGITIAAPWNVEVHDRRCEAVLAEQAPTLMYTPEEVL